MDCRSLNRSTARECDAASAKSPISSRSAAAKRTRAGEHQPAAVVGREHSGSVILGLPAARRIARAPILRRDGTICTEPGYDPVSRLYYCPDPGLTLSPIPDYPTTDEVQACIDILLKRHQ